MDALLTNITTVIGGIVVAAGMAVLNGFQNKKAKEICSQKEYCVDHQTILRLLIEAGNDVKWLVSIAKEKPNK